MKHLNKYVLGILIGIFMFVIYPYIKDYRAARDRQKFSEVLKEKEDEKVMVRGRVVTHVKRVRLPDGTERQKVTRKVGVRKSSISVGKDKVINVYALQYGPTFEPGISAGSGGGYFRIGLDAQLYYWKKWAIGGGLDAAANDGSHIRLHGGFFRDLYVPYFDNTSLYCGIDHTLDLRLNFRIRFGGDTHD